MLEHLPLVVMLEDLVYPHRKLLVGWLPRSQVDLFDANISLECNGKRVEHTGRYVPFHPRLQR